MTCVTGKDDEPDLPRLSSSRPSVARAGTGEAEVSVSVCGFQAMASGLSDPGSSLCCVRDDTGKDFQAKEKRWSLGSSAFLFFQVWLSQAVGWSMVRALLRTAF